MLPLFVALTLTLPAPTLFGRVVEQQSGLPLPYCDVRLAAPDRLASTDSSGVFALPDVPPGAHELIVSYPFHETRRLKFERGTTAHDTLQITLLRTQLPPFERVERPDPTPFPPAPFGRLEVHAVDGSGRPLQGLKVIVLKPGATAFSDSLGRCSFRHLSLGQTVVWTYSPIHIALADTFEIRQGKTVRWEVRPQIKPELGSYVLRLSPMGVAERNLDGVWQPYVYVEPYRRTVIRR